MARRKAPARAARTATGRRKAARKATKAARKAAARKAARKKPVTRKKPAARRRPAASKPARKAATRKKPAARTSTRKVGARKRPAAVKKVAAKKAVAKKAVAKKAVAKKAVAKRTAPKKAAPAKKAAPRKKAPPSTAQGAPAAPRTPPRLDRARWRVGEDGSVSGPPPRPVPAAGDLFDRLTADRDADGPSVAGGDVDADWASAASVGDEAPGGDNPTPDQDRVDDIGHAVGVEFEDEEVLDVEGKVADRDRHRWERDPGSSDDFDDR